MKSIRTLRADEIECRVQIVRENGFSLLLYKDARVDMNILDEVFGIYGWQRKHELIGDRLYCNISVWDVENKQWIEKQDVGTESYTEKEKGQASDSFKRAAFNIGIGRELYTAPFIWINNQGDIENKNGKFSVKGNFKVKEIEYNNNKEIIHLVIVDNKGKERYRLGSTYKHDTEAVDKPKTNNNIDEDKQAIVDGSLATDKQLNYLYTLTEEKGFKDMMAGYIKKTYGKDSSKELTKKEASEIIQMLQEMK